MAKFLTVRIGEHLCAVDVEHIIEVFHMMAFQDIPTKRADVLGFVTVRNQLMPLIDMRRRFGHMKSELKLDTPIVALREKAGPIALLFDDADRVEEIELSSASSLNEAKQFPDIHSVAKLQDHLLLILHTDKISSEIYASLEN